MLLRSTAAVSGLRNLVAAAARKPSVGICASSGLAASRVGLRFCGMAEVPARALHVERRLEELGLRMPAPSKPVASYVMCTRVGNLLYLAGHLPQPAEGPLVVGKVGAELTTEQAADAAKLVALNILATLKAELGDLDKVKKIVKLTGFVNCVDGFAAQPKVVNGASDTFVAVLGEKGKHSRSAVGTNALPLNVPVEIEAIVEVDA